MPDNLSDLFRRNRDPERPNVYEGTVSSGAGGLNGIVTVTIDGFDGGQQRWPVDGWSPRGDTYPKRGDRCLVTLSDSNRLWLLQWTPGGGGRGPGGRDPKPPPSKKTPTSDGVHTGTPKEIIDTIVIPIGVAHSLVTPPGKLLTPDNVTEWNANHTQSPTGARSDYLGPPDEVWAIDMTNGIAPTPEMNAAGKEIAEEFDMTWPVAGTTYSRHDGNRYQLTYHDGGVYESIIHFGIKAL